MRRIAGSLLLGAVAALTLSSTAQAQSVFFGGGPSLPMGEYKDYAKTGWLMTAGLSVDIGSKGLFLDIEGYFGSNAHKNTGTANNKTNLAAGILALGYTFGPAGKKVRPYVLAGGGILNHQFRSDNNLAAEGSQKMLAITGAAGLLFALNTKANFWVEARYLTGSKDGATTAVVPINVGISIALGGGN